MMLYTLEGVSRRHDRRMVLDINHLEIEAGRIVALLGPNGAGKTTLLNILAFLDTPTTGRISFLGQPVDGGRETLLHLRRQVVLVDQHPIMFSTSVAANIEFGLKIRKIARSEREQIVDRVLDTVGLARYRGAAAHELSGGETQRLALARALALDPKVLLCDEPTASVDAENQMIIIELLRRINATQNTSIVFTSHDRLQAAALAEQTLTLEQGRLAPASHDNRFGFAVVTGQDGRPCCLLNNRAAIPLEALPPLLRMADCGRLSVDPEKVYIHHRGAPPDPAHDITGMVVLTMAEGERVRLVVDIGVLLTAIMDRDRYILEHPAIGELVCLSFAAGAVIPQPSIKPML